MTEKAARSWWGEWTLDAGEAAEWTIGPLRFWLQRSAAEWRLVHDWEGAAHDAGWNRVRPAPLPEGDVQAQRFAVHDTTSRIVLSPRVADRAVVARPRTPFRVLPGERTRIFLSSPLWVEIAVGAGPAVLCDLPSNRLSDTWFGATTREGELCYSVKTTARTELANMPRAANRLLTPVVIDNQDVAALLIERISVPVPYLSVYGGAANEAWSEEVAMVRGADGDLASLDIRDGPPAEAADATLIGSPRQIADKGHLFRAFGSLLQALDLGG